EGSNTTLIYDFGDASQHPRTNWTSYNVPLDASEWSVGIEGDGGSASESQMRSVLSNLERVWIRGEYVTGS
ncbi:MAG: laminin B domain-containing protein, partial [Halobacteria archaeon]|nr:laminin B domain-containing protein [Halobacteria archaeon]